MKKFLIYKITNTINNKFYIGAHSTSNINDGYMGSGIYLEKAKKKYGINIFVKEILCECSSEEEMYAKEKELVTICEESYNLCSGGHGGWTYARSKITEESYKKVSDTMKTESYREKTKSQRENISKRANQLHKPEIKEKANATLKQTMNNPDWKNTTGKERANKISETMKEICSKRTITEDFERRRKIAEYASKVVRITIGEKRKKVLPEVLEEMQSQNIEFNIGWDKVAHPQKKK